MISYNEDLYPSHQAMQHTVVQQVQGTRKVLLHSHMREGKVPQRMTNALRESEAVEAPQVARLLYEFARSKLGAMVLILGVNIAINKIEWKSEGYSTEYRVVGTFTDEQLTKYEQWAMLQRLAGNLDGI